MSSFESINLIVMGFINKKLHYNLESDLENATYQISVKRDDEIDFHLEEVTEEVSGTISFLGENYMQLKVDALQNGEIVKTVYSNKVFTNYAEDAILITGNVKSLEGVNLSDVVIEIKLKSKVKDFEFVGSVVMPNIDGIIITDSNGDWSVRLFPNKSSDYKKISDDETYYEFDFLGKTYQREIDSSNGSVQSFFSLMEPEKLRKRRDNYDWSI